MLNTKNVWKQWYRMTVLFLLALCNKGIILSGLFSWHFHKLNKCWEMKRVKHLNGVAILFMMMFYYYNGVIFSTLFISWISAEYQIAKNPGTVFQLYILWPTKTGVLSRALYSDNFFKLSLLLAVCQSVRKIWYGFAVLSLVTVLNH